MPWYWFEKLTIKEQRRKISHERCWGKYRVGYFNYDYFPDFNHPRWDDFLRRTAKRKPNKPPSYNDATYWDNVVWPERYTYGHPHICVYSSMYGKGHEARKYFKGWKYHRQRRHIEMSKRRLRRATKLALKGNDRKLRKFTPSRRGDYDD